MEDFLKEIGIQEKGNKSPDGCYIVDFVTDDNEKAEDKWARAQSNLDRSDLVELDDDASMVTYDVSTQQYIGDKYSVTLNADLESDTYKLIVREN